MHHQPLNSNQTNPQEEPLQQRSPNKQRATEREQAIPLMVSSRFHKSPFKVKELTLITTTETHSSASKRDFKFKFSKPLHEGLTYKIIRAKHKRTGKKLFAKLHNKQDVDILSKHHCVENETLLLQNLRTHCLYLTKLHYVFEDKDTLYLMFDRHSNRLLDLYDQKSLGAKMFNLLKALMGFIEINAHGVAVTAFELRNIVKDEKGNLTLFNFEALTVYGQVPKKVKMNEFSPPEMKHRAEASSKTDSWIFGILMVYAFTGTFYPFEDKIEHEGAIRSLARKGGLPKGFLELVVKKILVREHTARISIEDVIRDPFFVNHIEKSSRCLQNLPDRFRSILVPKNKNFRKSGERKAVKAGSSLYKDKRVQENPKMAIDLHEVGKRLAKIPKDQNSDRERNSTKRSTLQQRDSQKRQSSRRSRRHNRNINQAILGNNKTMIYRTPAFQAIRKEGEEDRQTYLERKMVVEKYDSRMREIETQQLNIEMKRLEEIEKRNKRLKRLERRRKRAEELGVVLANAAGASASSLEGNGKAEAAGKGKEESFLGSLFSNIFGCFTDH